MDCNLEPCHRKTVIFLSRILVAKKYKYKKYYLLLIKMARIANVIEGTNKGAVFCSVQNVNCAVFGGRF